MQKIIYTFALSVALLSNAHASEWSDMMKAATAAASPQTKKAINDLLQVIANCRRCKRRRITKLWPHRN